MLSVDLVLSRVHECDTMMAERGSDASRQSKRNTYMQEIKVSIAPIIRRTLQCVALLFCSCCLTSCSIIGSIIALPFRLLDAVFG